MREETYRLYVTDTLQMRGENKYPTQRYVDLLKPRDNRSGDEVAADVITRLGLSFGVTE